MRSPVAFLTLAAAFVGGVFSQTINTPSNLAQCLPTLLSWSGTTGDVQLFITSGDAPSGPTTHDLGTQSGTSFTTLSRNQLVGVLVSNFCANSYPYADTRLVFNIRTSTGAIFQTGIVTVTTGGNTNCLNSSSGASSGSVSATSSAATSAGTSTTAAATTTATTAAGTTTATTAATSATRTTTSRTTGTTAASSAGSSTTSSGNSAPTQYSMGVAGVVGAAVIALLV
ncbi:hypothetical protein BDZ89DRAFT_1135747 [Hymenopellis radicata]|nr:hypothetical protein BDZ89DRAFT_1135747 [Hymenopellis radicata]